MPQPSKDLVKAPLNPAKSDGKDSGVMATAIAGVLLILYFGMNLLFNIYNKWLFSGPLPAPVFVTATHQAFCFLGALMAAAFAPESWYKRTPLEGSAMWSKLMIIPFGFCLNIGLNNISLLFCTLALNQLIRSFSPVAVAIASYFIEGRTYSYPKQATLGLLGVRVGASFDEVRGDSNRDRRERADKLVKGKGTEQQRNVVETNVEAEAEWDDHELAPHRTSFEWGAMWSKLMIIPFGFCLNIGLNNISLLFCTLALNQLIRSFSPVAVAIASYFIEGRTYSYPKQATLGLLVLGICLGVSSSPDFEMLGFLICAASVVGSTLQVVLTGYFMGGQKVTLHVFDILLYTAIPCILFLVPLAYATGDFPKTLAAIEDHGVGRFTGLVIAGGAMAFSYNIITILLIKYTSSVYYAVAGGFKVCLVIGSSFIFFDQQLSMLSLVGIIISCFAFVGNSYLTFKEKQQAKDKVKAKEVSEDQEGLITGKPKVVEAV
eukprot:CAMPEP_0167829168 /NCGR_PEP_ID=MMETSP0112_2-20121227/11971_1 /TAXON_ID=91324 /ORGANISM="Lotharella globosa, Strain CCCM811" /LENGTH=489 /DNA_ID=CAMNT_0007732755 /DNA_START=53 /DNA_END=1522 /DNA_ORIENTATION=-